MPLDEFQKGITNLLSANRDIDSPFAGGAVIHRHGFRLSRDQDIFSGSDVTDIAARDIATLEEAGYEIFVQRRYDGFIECDVVKSEEGATVLQWTQALSREFYEPVPDDRFGYRLHFADLAANKALAGATRSAVRDFVDLWMLDRHVLPLWRILCAAPGKDLDFNPLSMIERMLFNWHIAKARDADEYLATIDRSPESMGLSLLHSLRDASGILKDMPEEHYGRLQVRHHSRLPRRCCARPDPAAPSFLCAFDLQRKQPLPARRGDPGPGGTRGAVRPARVAAGNVEREVVRDTRACSGALKRLRRLRSMASAFRATPAASGAGVLAG